jgi:hypothetical protein
MSLDNFPLLPRESTTIHLVPVARSDTIMGLVEFDSGLISDAEPETFKTHRFNDFEGEKTHGS